MSGISGVGSTGGAPSDGAGGLTPAMRELSIMPTDVQIALLTALRGLSNSEGAAMHALARMVDVHA